MTKNEMTDTEYEDYIYGIISAILWLIVVILFPYLLIMHACRGDIDISIVYGVLAFAHFMLLFIPEIPCTDDKEDYIVNTKENK